VGLGRAGPAGRGNLSVLFLSESLYLFVWGDDVCNVGFLLSGKMISLLVFVKIVIIKIRTM
jgi:hypothetical protein